MTQGLLDILLDFVDHRPVYPLPVNETEDEDDDLPNYEVILKNISKTVTLVTMNGKYLRI